MTARVAQRLRALLPERIVEVEVERVVERVVILEKLRQPFSTNTGTIAWPGTFAMDATQRLYKKVGDEWIPQWSHSTTPRTPSYVTTLYDAVPLEDRAPQAGVNLTNA